MGDPIEVEALSRVLRNKSGRATLIGSVKTNLGHNEAASGITSIIKVALAFEKSMIPPTIGIKHINPALKLAERNIQVVTEPTPWPQPKLQRASINSFGYGGANAHIILESAAMHLPESPTIGKASESSDHNVILVFSASGEASLMSRVKDLASCSFTAKDLTDLAYTLAFRRSDLPIRGYLIANPHTFNGHLDSRNLRTLSSDTVVSPLPIAFVFTGQGAQWPLMGQQLLKTFPTYRRVIQDLDYYLACLPQAPPWTIEGKSIAAFLLFPANYVY